MLDLDVPNDIGEPQAQFEDAVCRLFESSEDYEILERNMYSDPFEPDIQLMDADEWVFRVVCWYQSEDDEGFVNIYPKTFGMRKWVTDHDDLPTFFLMGVGGTPSNPERFHLTRFFNIPHQYMDLSKMEDSALSMFDIRFVKHAIDRDFERIFSPDDEDFPSL